MTDTKDKKKGPLKGLKPEQEFLKELRKSSKKKNVKVMSISFNPIAFIIASIIIAGVIYTFAKAKDTKIREVTLGQFISNIKENKYSEVNIQNTGKDGKALAMGNSLEITKVPDNVTIDFEDLPAQAGSDNIRVFYKDDMETLDIDSLISSTTLVDIPALFGMIFSSDESTLPTEVWLIDDSVYSLSSAGKVGVLENMDSDTLDSAYRAKEFDMYDLPVAKLFDYKVDASVIDFDNFSTKYEDAAYTNIVVDGDLIIGQLDEDRVLNDRLDWGALSTDFPKLLQEEGISLDNPNVEISTEFVRGFNFDLVMQIAVLGAVIFLVMSILKGMSGGGKGLMQFGQSKAKMFFGKKPEVTFKDVAGVDSAKEELNEVVLFLKEPKRFTKLGARIPKGLLMVGSPGTGKTLLARAIAGEAGVPFFHTSGSEFEEMLVGAGASRVRDLFEKAKKASPAIIFIDEIDAVARKRGTTVQSSSTEQTLNQILVEMDGFEKNTNVIVLAATNRPDVLDPAILRPGRFDRRIVIDLPDIKGREEILNIHAKNKPLADNVSLAVVARRTVGYSGADLENLLNEAAIMTAKDNRTEISIDDIEEAANRVSMGRERKIERDTGELKKTAYHEAGHAIIAKLTPESDPVHKITIISRGMALGVTMQLPEKDKYSQSYTEMESRLRVLMGGRAAEELMYGKEKITSGASNDIQQATGLARKMIKAYGYSDKLGLVSYGASNELQYLGYGYGEQRDFSDNTARMIDEEVRRIIEEAYVDAVKLLTKKKDLLERVASDLMEKETIEGEEFDKYFE